MSENSLRRIVVKYLRPFGVIVPVESPITPGFPDYIYCLSQKMGVLELKYLENWPKRPMTPIRIGTLTLEQTLWAEGWAVAGGRYRMMLRIGMSAWLVFGPRGVRQLYDRRLVRAALPRAALLFSEERRFPARQVVKCLTL